MYAYEIHITRANGSVFIDGCNTVEELVEACAIHARSVALGYLKVFAVYKGGKS